MDRLKVITALDRHKVIFDSNYFFFYPGHPVVSVHFRITLLTAVKHISTVLRSSVMLLVLFLLMAITKLQIFI